MSDEGRAEGLIPHHSSLITHDGWLLFATCGVRTFAYGFLSVVLGLYLAALGLKPDAVGAVFTAALAGGAAMTVLFASVADRVGRRRTLAAAALLMAVGGVAYALSDSPIVLVAAAIVGTISPSGKEVGPFLSIEQAILPQTTSHENRTRLYATYNLVGSAAGACGALAAGVPSLVGLSPLTGYRVLMWAYAATALILLVLFSRLSSAGEASKT